MSQTRKDTSRQLKRPDSFQVMGMKFIDLLTSNVKVIALVLVPLALFLLGYVIWQYVQAENREDLLAELGAIELIYQNEESAANDQRETLQEQLTKLTSGAELPDPNSAAPTNSANPSPANSPEAALIEKKLNAIKADHSESLQAYRAFFEEHSNSSAGLKAGLTAADILLDRQDLKEALPLLERIVTEASTGSFYQTRAQLNLISLYEDQRDWPKALGLLQELESQSKDSDFIPKILLAKARVQHLAKESVKARETLNQLIAKHGATSEAQQARAMLVVLN